jgi:hypothetical protein
MKQILFLMACVTLILGIFIPPLLLVSAVFGTVWLVSVFWDGIVGLFTLVFKALFALFGLFFNKPTVLLLVLSFACLSSSCQQKDKTINASAIFDKTTQKLDLDLLSKTAKNSFNITVAGQLVKAVTDNEGSLFIVLGKQIFEWDEDKCYDYAENEWYPCQKWIGLSDAFYSEDDDEIIWYYNNCVEGRLINGKAWRWSDDGRYNSNDEIDWDLEVPQIRTFKEIGQ